MKKYSTIILSLIILMTSACVAGSSNNKIMAKPNQHETLPNIQVADLDGNSYQLPNQLPTDFNLLIFGFAHNQKDITATWVNPAKELQQKYDNFKFFKIPVIDNSNAALRLMIRNGMRAKADEETRHLTLTLFADKQAFLDSLGIENSETPHIILFNQAGQAIWRSTGEATSLKSADLAKLMAKLNKMKTAGP